VERTQRHIDCLYEQANVYESPVEYILVEWNPPTDKPPITDAVEFHNETPYWKPRIITVPAELHNKYRYSGKLPIYQMIAKNVGIRRARGDFILATNIDILMSDEMFLFATGPLLNKGTSYRVDRIDAGPNVPDGKRAAMLEYCRDNILRRNGRATTTDYTTNKLHQFCHRGYHASKHYAARWLMKVPKVHTMACGDFTLLHRSDWFGLRGYPEIEIFSIHIDSLLLLQAHYSGIRESVVPFPVYHIEHQIGTSLVPGGDTIMYKNLTAQGIPYLPLLIIPEAASDMREEYKNTRYRKVDGYWVYRDNREDWGLATHQLAEVSG
jgi:hypothetical protein